MAGTGAPDVCAPSPVVVGDGLRREDVAYSEALMGNRRIPNGMDSKVPKTTKLYFRLLLRVYSLKVKSKVLIYT